MSLAILFAAFMAVQPSPQSETTTKYCDYSTSAGVQYQGRCQETWNYRTGLHTITFPGHSFRIEDYEPVRHEGNFLFVRLNGQPTVGYMHHRAWIEYMREDRQESLNVCTRADRTRGCAN